MLELTKLIPNIVRPSQIQPKSNDGSATVTYRSADNIIGLEVCKDKKGVHTLGSGHVYYTHHTQIWIYVSIRGFLVLHWMYIELG